MNRYIVELSAGCYSGAFAPTVSEHDTWDAAVHAAIKSDRLVAVDTETGHRVQIPRQNDPRLGEGRFGLGITPAKAKKLGVL